MASGAGDCTRPLPKLPANVVICGDDHFTMPQLADSGREVDMAGWPFKRFHDPRDTVLGEIAARSDTHPAFRPGGKLNVTARTPPAPTGTRDASGGNGLPLDCGA